MKVNIFNQQKFQIVTRNLEALQNFKGPLLTCFERIVEGQTTTNPELAEFCYINSYDAKIEKFIKKTEASEENIAELFYKLAGLLERYELDQKRELMRSLEKVN